MCLIFGITNFGQIIWFRSKKKSWTFITSMRHQVSGNEHRENLDPGRFDELLIFHPSLGAIERSFFFFFRISVTRVPDFIARSLKFRGPVVSVEIIDR